MKKATGSGISQSIVSQAVRLSQRRRSEQLARSTDEVDEEAGSPVEEREGEKQAGKKEKEAEEEQEGETGGGVRGEGEGKVLVKAAVPYVNHRGIKFTHKRAGE